MCSPHPPCAWLPSVCADLDPRFAVFPLRPSSARATERRSSLAVQPSSGFHPGRLARLHGRLSWAFGPPSLRAFSARRAGTFAGRRLPARGVSSCAGRLPTSPPEGVACRRRWALARHLSCAFRARGRSRVRAALQSLLRRRRSRPLSKPRAAFRGPWFVVVPPDEDHPKHLTMATQAAHRLSTVSGTPVCIFVTRGWPAIEELQKFSPRPSTACGQRRRPRAMTHTRTTARAQTPVACR